MIEVRQQRRPSRVRVAGVGLLVVVGLLVALAGSLAAWSSGTLLDTDEFVATVQPLPSNPEVAAALGELATDELLATADVDAPPDLRERIAAAAAEVIASEQFNEVWVVATRGAHEAFSAVLTDNPDAEGIRIENGALILDLTQLVQRVRSALGPEVVGSLGTLPADAGEVVVVQETDLDEARDLANTLDTLGVVVPIVAVVLLVLAFALAWGFRRRAALAIGLGLAFVMAITLIALTVVQDQVTVTVDNLDTRAAVSATWDVVQRDLWRQTWALLILGLIIALVAWLSGPARPAVALRSKVRRIAGRDRPPGPRAPRSDIPS